LLYCYNVTFISVAACKRSVLSACDMAVYFDYKIPTQYPGCHDLIEWHKAYCLLAVSIHCSTTSNASVEFYKDEVSVIFTALQYEHIDCTAFCDFSVSSIFVK